MVVLGATACSQQLTSGTRICPESFAGIRIRALHFEAFFVGDDLAMLKVASQQSQGTSPSSSKRYASARFPPPSRGVKADTRHRLALWLEMTAHSCAHPVEMRLGDVKFKC
jgi:hypothetical protein